MKRLALVLGVLALTACAVSAFAFAAPTGENATPRPAAKLKPKFPALPPQVKSSTAG